MPTRCWDSWPTSTMTAPGWPASTSTPSRGDSTSGHDNKSALSVAYLDFVDHVEQQRTRRGLTTPVTYLIPYWFDGSNGEAPMVSFAGHTRYPFDHLLNVVDDGAALSVMAYRNRAQGEGGIIDLASQETAREQVPVIIGVETASIDPPTATFAGTDLPSFRDELRLVAEGTGNHRDRDQRFPEPLASRHIDMTRNETRSTPMSEFSPEEIIAYRFTRSRRKGYDTLQVDGYLERLAVHVGRMQQELARHQATERTALEVLQQAQTVADETVAAAQRDAEKLRHNAACGLENAKKDAHAMVNSARAEADRTLLTARVQAEAMVERGQAKLAELELAGQARIKEFEQVVDELRISATQSAGELRSAGSRLVEMAEHFEFELATRGEEINTTTDESIALEEQPVRVP